jgi:hypothetical protein
MRERGNRFKDMNTSAFSAGAVGNRPVGEYTSSNGTVHTITTSGLGPSFPSNDLLDKNAFKVVVASWKRINYGHTDTNDFEVHVGMYAPRQPMITRVQLVDVDIPNTQLLIEAAWCRMYYNMGARPSPECRSMSVLYTGPYNTQVTATMFLPLPLDAITYYEIVQSGVVKLYTQHRAPVPIVQLASVATALDQPLSIVGLPDGPFALDGRAVKDDSAMSFLVYSPELATALAALAALPTPPALYLCAAPLPGGPATLARVVSTSLATLLNTCTPTSTQCAPVAHWQFSVSYSPVTDTFELHVRPPQPGRIAVEGSISEYMGFGSPLVWDTGAPLQNQHIGVRFQQGPSFAEVRTGDPRRPSDLAEWVQDGFNAFLWQPFSFRIGFPTFPTLILPVVQIPGGSMDLNGLAQSVSEQLAAWSTANSTPLVICSTQSEPFPGLVFFSDPEAAPVIFTLDWLADPSFDPTRIGFDAQLYPAQDVHTPTRPAKHIPALPSLCGPTCCAPVQYALPPCSVRATYRSDTQQLALQTQPLPCYAVAVTDASDPAYSNLFLVTAAAGSGGWRHGLALGDGLVLSFTNAGTYTQVQTVVVEIISPVQVKVALVYYSDLAAITAIVGLDPEDYPVSACPSNCCPLTLFMQRRNADTNASTTDTCLRTELCEQGYTNSQIHGQTVDPEVFGFDAFTYPSCGCLLVSPGSLKICQESYVLVCLAFTAGDAIPCTGDVYYPFHNDSNSPIVFAKVLRSTFLRADFDRVFDHKFAGTGIHLGYIRVRILNPNGTLYQTHGKSLTITLKFDCFTTLISFGDGHVVMPGEDGRVAMPPISRGVRFEGQMSY